jgi:hypothetical protein
VGREHEEGGGTPIPRGIRGLDEPVAPELVRFREIPMHESHRHRALTHG